MEKRPVGVGEPGRPMPTAAVRSTRLPFTSCRRLRERSIRIARRVRPRSTAPSFAFSQPSVPLGRSVLVTPTHLSRRAATVRVAGDPNWVRAPMRARTLPPGFERSWTPRRTWSTEYAPGLGAGATSWIGSRGRLGAWTAAGRVCGGRCERARCVSVTAMRPRIASRATTSVVARDGRTMARCPDRQGSGPCCAYAVKSWTCVVTLSGDPARFEVSADLALHALERVVDRLRVAVEARRDRLVRIAVQVERQHRALELREHAGQACHQRMQLLAGDHLVHRVVRGRARQDLVQRRVRLG